MPRSTAGVFSVINPVLVGNPRSSSEANENFEDMGDEITATLPTSGVAAMTGPIQLAGGSLAAPGLCFADDRDVGFYLASSGIMSWVAGGIRKTINADLEATIADDADVAGNVAFGGAVSLGKMAGLNDVDTTGYLLKDDGDVSGDDCDVIAQFSIEARSTFGQLIGITTGVRADIAIPFDCTLTGIALALDQVGNVVLDVWKGTYANFPPTVDDSICGASKPTVSNLAGMIDDALAGWTKTVTAGDVLRFNVESASGVSRITVVVKARRFGD